jgi:hypothetical protein
MDRDQEPSDAATRVGNAAGTALAFAIFAALVMLAAVPLLR